MGEVAPAPEFVSSILSSLNYWRARTVDLDDRAIIELDPERQNLFRAMQFGLALPEAWESAAAIAVQSIPLVNRRMYRTEWLPVLQQLIDQAPAGQDPWRIQLMVHYGRMLRLQRQLDRAIEIHHQAQALGEAVGDTHLLALVTFNLARDHIDKRRYEEAVRYSRATIKTLGETGDPHLLALAYDCLGWVYRDQGDFEESIMWLTKALEIEKAGGDPTRLVRALVQLATTLRTSGQLDEAIVHYEAAAEIIAVTANELDKILILMNLGGAYFDKGEWLLAERTFRQVDLAYLQRSGNLHYEAVTVVCLGNVFLKQQRLVEAEVTLRRSVTLFERIDAELELANALGSLGEVLAAQGSPEAQARLDEALKILDNHPEDRRAQRLRVMFQTEKDKLSKR